jgi:hypothetical protein
VGCGHRHRLCHVAASSREAPPDEDGAEGAAQVWLAHSQGRLTLDLDAQAAGTDEHRHRTRTEAL